MIATQLPIPFAIDESGEPVNVKDVAKGLACVCRCPKCGSQVIAKQGSAKIWHFAHYNAEECAGGYESAMHLAVKKIIETERAIFLPACGVLRHPQPIEAPVQDRAMVASRTHRRPTCFDVWEYSTGQSAASLVAGNHGMGGFGNADIPGRSIAFDAVAVEQNDGDIRPDLIGIIGGHKLYIEVTVTHFIDEAKLAKIRARGIPTIEIVLSRMEDLDWDRLRQIVLTDSGNAFWRYNPKAEQLAEIDHQEKLEAIKQQREIAQREAETKKRIYEQRFKPSHEVAFEKSSRFGGGSRIWVRLCPSDVNLSVYPFDPHLAEITKRIAKAHGGRYNADYQKWEFPSQEDLFYKIAKALKHHDDNLSFAKMHCNKAVNDPVYKEFLRRLGFKAIDSAP